MILQGLGGTEVLRIIPITRIGSTRLRFIDIPARCGNTGFPSPAEDYLLKKLSLDELLNIKESTTFYFEAVGDSMIGFGIQDGSILVVDTTLDMIPGEACLCRLDGELMVKMIEKKKDGIYLVSANPNKKPIKVEGESELIFFGLITSIINRRLIKHK